MCIRDSIKCGYIVSRISICLVPLEISLSVLRHLSKPFQSMDIWYHVFRYVSYNWKYHQACHPIFPNLSKSMVMEICTFRPVEGEQWHCYIGIPDCILSWCDLIGTWYESICYSKEAFNSRAGGGGDEGTVTTQTRSHPNVIHTCAARAPLPQFCR